ncbi:MAG: flagellar motor switch phosphatase FliY [Thermoleophilia bacterium]
MSGGSLSQEEIDALMAGAADGDVPAEAAAPEEAPEPEAPMRSEDTSSLSPVEIDTIGEVGNICMSSAATALSTLLSRKVQITTPSVDEVDEGAVRRHFDSPAVVVVIEYTEGLAGRNVFILTQRDASVVADLMMGGEGAAADELTDLHASAIGEAMNQMMGSASTAMAEMAGHRVDISAPSVAILDLSDAAQQVDLGLEGRIVRTSFQLRVDDLLDTTLMQLMPVDFARGLVDALNTPPAPAEPAAAAPAAEPAPAVADPATEDDRHLHAVPVPVAQPVSFPSLDDVPAVPGGSDISLLLDVPLQVTVELGRTQMRIRNVLELVPGSIVELDKLAGEPVDVLVNGKQIARGEVVVIDEEFGVRITDVASQAKRLRGLAAGEE